MVVMVKDLSVSVEVEHLGQEREPFWRMEHLHPLFYLTVVFPSLAIVSKSQCQKYLTNF